MVAWVGTSQANVFQLYHFFKFNFAEEMTFQGICRFQNQAASGEFNLKISQLVNWVPTHLEFPIISLFDPKCSEPT